VVGITRRLAFYVAQRIVKTKSPSIGQAITPVDTERVTRGFPI